MKKEETVVQSLCTDHIAIIVHDEDAAGNPTTQTWKLCIDYRAIAKVEVETGRDLKKLESWKDISSGKDFPKIVWCCLGRYNPNVTLDDVLDKLNPAAQRILSDELFFLCFPGMREALDKEAKGETVNPQTATLNA